ncbi:HGGxSTG domain-containing protein [Gymnodinialimonas ulvae]|uniref:HGGxSTG domain-containing protein n=1 Tax=Gymnodinialimonas ulvae TaxID=3126504 RepID=UPI00309D69F0
MELCGAKTRTGEPCQRKPILGRKRCRNHGGMSTGPKTEEGLARIAEGQRRRWKKELSTDVTVCAQE